MENLVDDTVRVCKQCGVKFSKTREFFHAHGKGLLRAICKGCASDNFKTWYITNRDGKQEKSRAYYTHNKQRQNLTHGAYKKTLRYKYSSYKTQAKRRGLVFILDFSLFETLCGLPCAYCGGLQTFSGIDRVDNTLGYLPENVVSCCSNCNTAKLDLTKDEFFSMCLNVCKTHNLTHYEDNGQVNIAPGISPYNISTYELSSGVVVDCRNIV